MTKYDQAVNTFFTILIFPNKDFRHLVASVFVLFEQLELLCKRYKLFQKSKTIFKKNVILILSFPYVM